MRFMILVIIGCILGSSRGEEELLKIAKNTPALEDRQLHDVGDTIFGLGNSSSQELIEQYIAQLVEDAPAEVCYDEMTGYNQVRAMPYYAGRGTNFNTANECLTECLTLGHTLSARSDNKICFCGDPFGYEYDGTDIIYSQHGVGSSCDCANLDDEDKELGANLMCVTEVLKAEFLGCYIDDIPRALPIVPDGEAYGNEPISDLSYSECAFECYGRGYQFFGRQHDRECWCGSGYTYDIYGSLLSTDTNYCACNGVDIGFFRQCIYKIPDGDFHEQSVYLGCYKDKNNADVPFSLSNNDFALSDGPNIGYGSIDECYEYCKSNSYDLYALQFTMECWCGDSGEDDPYMYGHSTSCDCKTLTQVGSDVFCLFAILNPHPPVPSPVPSMSSIPSPIPTLKPETVALIEIDAVTPPFTFLSRATFETNDSVWIAEGDWQENGNTGSVVIRKDSNNFQKLNGLASVDQFGRALTMSSDASLLVVGAPKVNNNGKTDVGSVIVYQFNESANLFVEFQSLFGEVAFDIFGQFIALTFDYRFMVVAAPWADIGATRTGSVYLYGRLSIDDQFEEITRIDGQCAQERLGYEGVGIEASLDSILVHTESSEVCDDGNNIIRSYKINCDCDGSDYTCNIFDEYPNFVCVV